MVGFATLGSPLDNVSRTCGGTSCSMPPKALLRRTQWLAAFRSRSMQGSNSSELLGRGTARLPAAVIEAQLAASPVAALRNLYPASKAHKQGKLQVSPLHTLAYEVHGNPRGQPVLCVHGGPGARAYANHARFFDPRHWRVVLVDQRGCGASTPRGCLEDNTTQALVADFELLRQKLRVEKWMLFGGSWGTALSLAYAQAHPERVVGLVLRAVCLMTPPEIDWMYRGGVAALQPKAWDDFVAALPAAERADPLTAYHQRLISPDAAARNAAAAAWLQFDMAAGKLPSQQLQAWDGAAWQATDIGGAPAHRVPPATRPLAAGNGSNNGGGDGSGNSGPVAAGTAALGQTGASAAGAAGGKHASPPWAPQPGSRAGSGPSSAAKPAPDLASKQQAQYRGITSGQAAASTAGKNNDGTGAGAGTGPSRGSSRNGAEAKGAPALPAGDAGMSHFTAQAMLEAHYCVNGAFSLRDRPILQDVERLRGIPAIAVQGRMDLVCPPVTAYKLHKAWPELRLRLVGGAGHSQYDPAIAHELLEATDAMRDQSWVPLAPELQVAVY